MFSGRSVLKRRWIIGPALALTLGVGVAAAPAMAAPARNAAAPAVALASRYKGVPYVWGGTTTRGFDCSGYVQFIFNKLGVSLPRTAEAQWQHVEHISRAQLRPGDLVFWGRPYGVYHVGIYAGDDKIWNAPHTGARVHLETIWGGAKLYGRVRGLTLTTTQSGSSSPVQGLLPVGAIGSGAPLTLAPTDVSASSAPAAATSTTSATSTTPAPAAASTTPAPAAAAGS